MAEPTFTRQEAAWILEHIRDETVAKANVVQRIVRAYLALLDRAEAAERERSEWQEQWHPDFAARDRTIAEQAARIAELEDAKRVVWEFQHADGEPLADTVRVIIDALNHCRVSRDHLRASLREQFDAFHQTDHVAALDDARRDAERKAKALESAKAAIRDAHYGKGLAIDYVRAVDAEIAAALAQPATREGECASCDGRRWVEDENWQWQPGEPSARRPHDGLIPCGACNEGGWDTAPPRQPGSGGER